MTREDIEEGSFKMWIHEGRLLRDIAGELEGLKRRREDD